MICDQFDALTRLHGALVVGSPEQVAEKIPFQQEVVGHERFLMPSSVGTEVTPLVRAELARRSSSPAQA